MNGVDVQSLAAELAPLLDAPLAKPLLDASEAAALLNVPESWVRSEARAGRIPSVSLGRYIRFKRDQLSDWLDRRPRGAAAATPSWDPACSSSPTALRACASV